MVQLQFNLLFSLVIGNKHNVTEEVASLVPLKDTAKSLHMYEAVKITLKWFSLTFVSISDITTDGALVMAGKKEGLMQLIENNEIAARNTRLMKYLCIIYQENICTKALKMNSVTQMIIKALNL